MSGICVRSLSERPLLFHRQLFQRISEILDSVATQTLRYREESFRTIQFLFPSSTKRGGDAYRGDDD
jgi:hypothetical protein